MKTNHEIDTLIAEKVMGYTHIVRMFGNIPIYEWQTPAGVMRQEDWQPSKDISQAWKVLEKLQEEGWLGAVAYGPGFIRACFQRMPEDAYNPETTWVGFDGTLTQEGETASMAICLAALKTKGVI